MRKLLLFTTALLALAGCVRTHGGNPYVPSIVGSWLVTDLEVTGAGDNAGEAERILLELFAGFDGSSLVFNPDGTVEIPGGTAVYTMTDFYLWIIPIGGASVEFTAGTLTDTDLSLTCDALTGISEPVVFPSGVTSLQLYMHAERQ